jgi:hypothetical protein
MYCSSALRCVFPRMDGSRSHSLPMAPCRRFLGSLYICSAVFQEMDDGFWFKVTFWACRVRFSFEAIEIRLERDV